MGIRTKIRNLIFSIAPDTALVLFSIRSRRKIEKSVQTSNVIAMSRDTVSKTSGTVQAGPFKGLKLDLDAFPQHISPKIYGTYEDELHDFVDDIIDSECELVVNIGTAEGYYAVGFAQRLPDAKILGFDADPKAQRAVRHNAQKNSCTDNIEVSGVLRKEKLRDIIKAATKPAVLSDCEGGELELLDLQAVPDLARSRILIECHPGADQNVVEILTKRFSTTHKITRRDPDPVEAKLARADTLKASITEAHVNEHRSFTPWLYCEPLNEG